RFCIAELSMIVVGVGVVKSLVRLMREPVTVISSRIGVGAPACEAVSSAGFAGPCAASCACAVAPRPNTRAAVQTVRVRCLVSVGSNRFELVTATFTAASIAEWRTVIRPPPLSRLASKQVKDQTGKKCCVQVTVLCCTQFGCSACQKSAGWQSMYLCGSGKDAPAQRIIL